jgi:hypothetical protein
MLLTAFSLVFTDCAAVSCRCGVIALDPRHPEISPDHADCDRSDKRKYSSRCAKGTEDPTMRVLLLAMLTFTAAIAQAAAGFVFSEKPGAFAVGFKVVEQYDETRSFLGRIDPVTGKTVTANRAPHLACSLRRSHSMVR